MTITLDKPEISLFITDAIPLLAEIGLAEFIDMTLVDSFTLKYENDSVIHVTDVETVLAKWKIDYGSVISVSEFRYFLAIFNAYTLLTSGILYPKFFLDYSLDDITYNGFAGEQLNFDDAYNVNVDTNGNFSDSPSQTIYLKLYLKSGVAGATHDVSLIHFEMLFFPKINATITQLI